MSSVIVVALAKVKPGSEDAAVAVLTPVIEQSQGESGCVAYALHRSNTDPQQFVIIEKWASQEDLDAHFQMPYMGSLFSDLAELLDEPPSILFTSSVAVGDAVKGVL